MSTGITCTVDLDGVRVADGSPGDPENVATALDNLSVTWGRSDTMTQPDADVCAFKVTDPTGAGFGPAWRVGHRIDVLAHGNTYPDPSQPTFTNPGFETTAITWSTTGGTAARTSSRAATGTSSLAVHPTTPGVSASVLLAPAPFQPPGTNPDAWDTIPTTAVGQTWTATVTVWAPTGSTVTVRAATFTGPYAAAGAPAGTPQIITGNGAWQTITAQHVMQVDDRWLGLHLTLDPTGPAWDELAPTLTWDTVDPTLTWDDQGTLYVDDAQLTSPAAGTGRGVLVFSGRITDLATSYDVAPFLDVTAVGFTADLDNRTIGDNPWTVEPVLDRAQRIIDLAGLPIDLEIDDSVADTLLSYRDVDAQGATGLLKEIAVSVDGVLWPAVHVSLGAYLHLEDPALRVSLLQLTTVPGPPPVLLRRNWLRNPRAAAGLAVWAKANGTAEVSTAVYVTGVDGPNGVTTSWRKTVTTAKTGGTAGMYHKDNAGAMAGALGDVITGSIYVRPSVTMNLYCRVDPITSGGGGAGTNKGGTPQACPANVWTRLSVTHTTTAAYASVQVAVFEQSASILPAGGTLECTAAMVEKSGTLGAWFAGSTPDTADRDYAWAGTVDASASTESTVQTSIVTIGQGDPATGLDLSACLIDRDPVTWVQTVADVITRVAVGWLVQGVDDKGKPTTTDATEQLVDAALEAQHGTRRVQVSTQLQAAVDATDVAERILSRSSPEGWRAAGLTIDDDDVIGGAEGVALVLDLLDGTSRIGAPIVLGDLPDWSPAGTSAGVYLEGGTYRFTGGRWVLELTVSAATGLGGSAAWDELDPTWSWDQWDPAITWNDLRGVAAP